MGHARRFLLSFTATALVIAPFVLNADAPPPFAQTRVAPAPGQDSVVSGLTFHSEVVKNDGRMATIRIATKNDGGSPVSADVVATFMQRPFTSPMARMVPPPREVAAREIHVELAPGERFTRTITVALPAEVRDQIERAAAAARPNSANHRPNDFERRPPSFYTLVRAPAPPVQPAEQQAQFAQR